MIAAALVLGTAAIAHIERDTWSANLPEPVELHAASAAEWQTIEHDVPIAWRGRVAGGTLTIRAKTEVTEDDEGASSVTPHLAFDLARERYVVPMDDWSYVGCHRELNATMPVKTFGARNGAIAGFVVSTHVADCGMHGSSDTEIVTFIDVHQSKPRAVKLSVDDVELWGYANGGTYGRDGKVVCDWERSDFVCKQTENVYSTVGNFTEARRFTLFGGKALRVERAHTLLDAASSAGDQPVLVDGSAPLVPVTRIGDARLYATLERMDAQMPVFHLYRDGRIVSVTPDDLSDEFREPPERPEEEPDAIPMTITNSVATYRTRELAHTPHSQLLQVVLDSGEKDDEARSLFWVAVDAENMKLAALRVASTAREGERRERTVPGSIVSYKATDATHFAAKAYGPWTDDVFGGARCDEEQEDDCDVFEGIIGWSPDGFSPAFTEQPSDPAAPQVTISPDGTLGTAPRDHGGE